MSGEISVALCTRNGAAFIETQLRSILAQTVRPSEIVLSDDASTDDTVDIAVALVTAEGAGVSLHVLRNDPPRGVTANFEQAILACRGEFVALSDQDDVWMPNRLATALAVFTARPGLELVHSDAELIDDRGASLDVTLFQALEVGPLEVTAIHDGRGLELLLRRNIVTGATLMLRRELAVAAAPFPDAWLHDEWLAIVAASRGGFDVVAEPLIRYRQHGANEVGAAKLSVAGKFRRMIEPGALRSERLLARASQLAERAPALMPALVPAAVDKLAHERMRSALPAFRPARLAPVLRELGTGRYRRFGRGATDAARDLLQPLGGSR
jgi:glycosyltransferase involved in cell wall biosynthesis